MTKQGRIIQEIKIFEFCKNPWICKRRLNKFSQESLALDCVCAKEKLILDVSLRVNFWHCSQGINKFSLEITRNLRNWSKEMQKKLLTWI